MSYSRRHHHLRQVVSLAAAVVLLSGACGGSDESAGSTSAVSATSPIDLLGPAEFSSFLAADADVPLINVHVPYEGHIDGTDAFIAFDSILESDDLPTDRSAPIALYCRSGNMSAKAATDLVEAGYTNVVDLDGGMNAWAESGNGLVDDPSIIDD